MLSNMTRSNSNNEIARPPGSALDRVTGGAGFLLRPDGGEKGTVGYAPTTWPVAGRSLAAVFSSHILPNSGFRRPSTPNQKTDVRPRRHATAAVRQSHPDTSPAAKNPRNEHPPLNVVPYGIANFCWHKLTGTRNKGM